MTAELLPLLTAPGAMNLDGMASALRDRGWIEVDGEWLCPDGGRYDLLPAVRV